MTAAQAILLGTAVAIQAVCAIGMLTTRAPLDRLHLVGPVSVLATVAVVAAVAIDPTSSSQLAKAVVTGLFVWLSSPFLSRATSRALRIRARGELTVPSENVEQEGGS